MVSGTRSDGTTPYCTNAAPWRKGAAYLFRRMVQLAGAITAAIVDEYGPEEMLRRCRTPGGSRPLAAFLVLTGTVPESRQSPAVRSRRPVAGWALISESASPVEKESQPPNPSGDCRGCGSSESVDR